MGDVTKGKCGRKFCKRKAASDRWVWVKAGDHEYETVLCREHADEIGAGPAERINCGPAGIGL